MHLKSITLVSFLLLRHTIAFGQSALDYTSYYTHIILVEESIANENFKEAADQYISIFKSYNHIIAKDAYNACQVAALCKHENFNFFYEKCAAAGFKKLRLLASPYIRKQYELHPEVLDSIYLTGYNQYIHRIDTTLRFEFRHRYDLEQSYKSKPDYAAICTDNFNRIKTLISKGLYPGEDLIGINDNGESYAFPTLLHYPYAYRELEEDLWKAVKEGKISPSPVLYLYSFNQTRTSILYTDKVPVDTIHFHKRYNVPFGLRSNDLEQVNADRKDRNVMSVDMEHKLKGVSDKYLLNFQFGY